MQAMAAEFSGCRLVSLDRVAEITDWRSAGLLMVPDDVRFWIGVGTKESFAPPSEPNRQFSCIRLSSWWLLSRRSTNHGVSLF